jgi:phosphosulfolactate synthase (CoM biosynthesis protein A)
LDRTLRLCGGARGLRATRRTAGVVIRPRTKGRARVDRPYAFLDGSPREPKPRSRALTEIRGPYYTPIGPRYLTDLLEMVGHEVDILKFGGGSFSVMPRRTVAAIIDICHAHDVRVSTGGFIERALVRGPDAVNRYIDLCKDYGFDIIEISAGLVSMPLDDMARIVERVIGAGMTPKPEIGIQFGAGGGEATTVAELEAEGSRDPEWAILQAKRLFDAGAPLVMIESEGITENVRAWRTDVIARLIGALGLERVMFEAADPHVLAWHVKNYGPEVNLFCDHSQVLQLACLRAGIWGPKSLWGRVVSYKG